MNKTVNYLLAAIALLLVAGCASFHFGGPKYASPFFRINMGLKFGAHFPAYPQLQGSDKEWVDVANWQAFLESQKDASGKPLLSAPYTKNFFDLRTQSATIAFQKLAGLPQTGCVNLATYHEAVTTANSPMPLYKTVRAANCKTIHRPHGRRAATHGMTAGVGDPFRDHWMALNCHDNTTWCDVYDWEVFLSDNGYLMGNYPTTPASNAWFDSNVQTATTLFQSKWNIIGDPTGGKVGTNTFNVATGVGTIGTNFKNMNGELLGSCSDLSLTPRPTASPCP